MTKKLDEEKYNVKSIYALYAFRFEDESFDPNPPKIQTYDIDKAKKWAKKQFELGYEKVAMKQIYEYPKNYDGYYKHPGFISIATKSSDGVFETKNTLGDIKYRDSDGEYKLKSMMRKAEIGE